MGINLTSNKIVAAWMKYAKEHPKEFSSYDGACSCEVCCEYRVVFYRWFEEQEAASAAAGGGE